jgi:hypothetical protein
MATLGHAAIEGVSMGLASAMFWKKDFVIQDIVTVSMLLQVACWIRMPVMVTMLLAVVLHSSFPKTVFDQSCCRMGTAFSKNWRMFVLVSGFWTCYRYQLHYLTESSHFVSIAAASVQLLRRPEALKQNLREWRVATGPLYTIAGSVAFYHRSEIENIAGMMVSVLGMFVLCVAAMALRPDNQELDRTMIAILRVEALPWPRSFAMRGKCHGILMVLSLVLMAIQFVEQMPFFLICMALLVMEFSRRLKPS